MTKSGIPITQKKSLHRDQGLLKRTHCGMWNSGAAAQLHQVQTEKWIPKHSLIHDQSRLIFIMVISQDILNLLSRDILLRFALRDVRGVAVVLQLIFAALRVARFIVGILVRVVVGQGHLAKLLLRGERLGARLEVLQTGMIK